VTPASLVTTDHLSVWHGQVIGLNDVTVTAPAGITGLLGSNGAWEVDLHEARHRPAEAEQGQHHRARRADLAEPAALHAHRLLPGAGRSTTG
jgi:hypothetical protein